MTEDRHTGGSVTAAAGTIGSTEVQALLAEEIVEHVVMVDVVEPSPLPGTSSLNLSTTYRITRALAARLAPGAAI